MHVKEIKKYPNEFLLIGDNFRHANIGAFQHKAF